MPSGPERRVGWLRGVTFAHRGWHAAERMENSPAAFRAAVAAGLGIECDVQLTADDDAVVFHDFDLDRLTGKQGAVRGKTIPMLAAFPLRSGEPIWSLSRLLAEVGERVPLLVEIKSRHDMPSERLCRSVARALEGYRGQVAVMSFDSNVVRWFAANASDVVRGLVVTEEGQRGAFAVSRAILAERHARAEFIAFDVRDLPSPFATAMRAKGLPLLSWTVRDAETLAVAREHADSPIAEAEGLELALRDA